MYEFQRRPGLATSYQTIRLTEAGRRPITNCALSYRSVASPPIRPDCVFVHPTIHSSPTHAASMAAVTPPKEHTSAQIVSAFLQTIEHGIIPLTAIGVASGNKVFGAAILRKSDLSLVIAATNQETNSPLLVSCHPMIPDCTFWEGQKALS